MRLGHIVEQFERLSGTFGVIAQTHESESILNYRADETFPLASTAKLVLGTYVASLVASGDLSWDLRVQDIALDKKEDSHVIYPHLQHASDLSLNQVVEIMIACHDQHCANAVADVLGGWDATHDLISGKFPGLKIGKNPRHEGNNNGTLSALFNVVQCAIDGYLMERQTFEPVIAGLVRMADKTLGIPPQHQWNMTGGLPRALLDIGVLGNPMSGEYLMYAIAGRDLINRELSQGAELLTAELIKSLYETWRVD